MCYLFTRILQHLFYCPLLIPIQINVGNWLEFAPSSICTCLVFKLVWRHQNKLQGDPSGDSERDLRGGAAQAGDQCAGCRQVPNTATR